MRHQKMMTWVSISGTALSIFLVMVFFMTEEIKTVEVSPESNRHNIYAGQYIHIREKKGRSDNSSSFSYDVGNKLYHGLDGVVKESYIKSWMENKDVSTGDGDAVSALPMEVDNVFWEIFDFRFVDGRAFDKAESDSNSKVVVLTRSLARKLFGEEKVTGREVTVNWMPYRVVGVVDDVNPILGNTFANLYMIYNKTGDNNGYFGSCKIWLLVKPGVKQEDLQKQVKSRYATIQSELDKEDKEIVYHGQPYTTEEVALGGYGSNTEPELATHKRINMVIYIILILLPAINLSSMTRSRLRHRVSEIGVRRAFGAKKRGILGQMLCENFIITLAGGIIGLVLSVLFVILLSHLFFQFNGSFDPSVEIINARPTFEMLFTWKNFLMALALCLVLNILSATVPAWQASRVQPAVAIARVK